MQDRSERWSGELAGSGNFKDSQDLAGCRQRNHSSGRKGPARRQSQDGTSVLRQLSGEGVAAVSKGLL